MQTVKILKRKDASSVLVAVVLAFLVSNAVQAWTVRPAAWLSGETAPGDFWNAGLWQPFITLVVGLVILEVVVRVYTLLASSLGK
jgi:hypothetical protein